MKKCRRCSKPATLHITEVREGKAVAVHLCETCAREYLETPDDSSTSSPASDLAAKLEELVNEGSEESLASLSCSTCGITFAEFRESGRFGCPHDYTEFMNELLPLLENIHEDTKHTGKCPGSRRVAAHEQTRMIQLRNLLQDAIECEDYESAARLRDEIASLEALFRAAPPAVVTPTPTPTPTKRKRSSKSDESV